jgi:prepilin-type N-terminal cleavage/methylation domain-containing protein
MKLSRRHRHGGFSLVELMVVIAIIGVLVAMLVPAVNMVQRRAKNAKTKLGISNLANALENFKLEYGDYPPDFTSANPAREIDLFLARKFRYRVKSTDAQGPQDVAPPPVRLPDTPVIDPDITKLDPTEALYFWLRGFSNSAKYPVSGDLMTPLAMRLDEERDPLFEFDPTRLTDQDQDGNPEFLPETSEGAKVPYVYYNNRTYLDTGQWVQFKTNVMATAWVQTAGIPRPYLSKTADPPTGPDGTALQPFGFAEPKKFQIIAAGLDEVFTDINRPAPFAYGGGVYPEGQGYTEYDRDNTTNFVEGTTLQDDIP